MVDLKVICADNVAIFVSNRWLYFVIIVRNALKDRSIYTTWDGDIVEAEITISVSVEFP